MGAIEAGRSGESATGVGSEIPPGPERHWGTGRSMGSFHEAGNAGTTNLASHSTFDSPIRSDWSARRIAPSAKISGYNSSKYHNLAK